MDWANTTAKGDEKHLYLGFDATYIRGFTVLTFCEKNPPTLGDLRRGDAHITQW